ncbi:hypothetical protein HYW94_01260 [Candidatus Uhrbacteria bacterium]|nr:hypothetical protein [Candidatus Uhrbacteria bacterium]
MEKLTKIFGSIVGTFLTSDGGESISAIGRLQAEMKQQNDEFWSAVADAKAGIHKEVVSFVGAGDSTPREFAGATITSEKIREIDGVAQRNAQTATLMYGLKVYQDMRKRLETMDLRLQIVDALPEQPQYPVREEVELPEAPAKPLLAKRGSLCDTKVFMELDNIEEMIQNLNPEVLAKFDFAFWRKANELNSQAAALGKLISEKGSFFRELIKPLPKGDKQVTQSGVVITQWVMSYSEENLGEFSRVRDELQERYDSLQKQLNGCRKQVKDAVRAYNLDEERRYQTDWSEYAAKRTEYDAEVERLQAQEESKFQAALEVYRVLRQKYEVELERIRSAAETLRQQALSEMAGLRVRTE